MPDNEDREKTDSPGGEEQDGRRDASGHAEPEGARSEEGLSAREGPGEPELESGGEDAGPASEAPAAGEAPRAGQDGPPNISMSDELQRALEEAEAAVESGGDDEIEVDLGDYEDDGEDLEEGDAGEAVGPEEEGGERKKKFDPNAVEKPKDKGPPPPTKKEQELKLQILDLRAQLREKDAELDKRTKEMRQNSEQARRLQSNFDGYKQRVNKEKADWFNYGHEPIIRELLPVVDNLERGLEHASKADEVKPLVEGVEMTLRQFYSVLDKFGVKPIESEGAPFNPEVHQAMMQQETGEVPPNTVIVTHQKGYMLKDRLLRAAMVVVSKAPPGAETKAEQAGGPQGENESAEKEPAENDSSGAAMEDGAETSGGADEQS